MKGKNTKKKLRIQKNEKSFLKSDLIPAYSPFNEYFRNSRNGIKELIIHLTTLPRWFYKILLYNTLTK